MFDDCLSGNVGLTFELEGGVSFVFGQPKKLRDKRTGIKEWHSRYSCWDLSSTQVIGRRPVSCRSLFCRLLMRRRSQSSSFRMKFPAVILFSLVILLIVCPFISCDKKEDVIKSSSTVTSTTDKLQESSVKQLIAEASDLKTAETGHHGSHHWDHGGKHGSHGHHSKHGGE